MLFLLSWKETKKRVNTQLLFHTTPPAASTLVGDNDSSAFVCKSVNCCPEVRETDTVNWGGMRGRHNHYYASWHHQTISCLHYDHVSILPLFLSVPSPPLETSSVSVLQSLLSYLSHARTSTDVNKRCKGITLLCILLTSVLLEHQTLICVLYYKQCCRKLILFHFIKYMFPAYIVAWM